MNPWALLLGITFCVVFPPLIPLALLALAWGWATHGGPERVALRLETTARHRHREAYLAGLTFGPVPVYDEDDDEARGEGIFDTCLSCREPTRFDLRRGRWVHVITNDSCWEPIIPRKETSDA